MSFKNKSTVGLLAGASVSVLHAAAAQGAYSYSTAVSYAPVPDLGNTITLLSGNVASDAPQNLTVATFAYAPTAAGNGSQNVVFTESLAGTPGTETVAITGTLAYTYFPTFVAASFTPLSETVTGSGYDVPFLSADYLPSNLAGTAATLTLAVTPAAVPEPASAALLAVAGVGLLARRRRA